MADGRYGRPGTATNSPYGQEDSDREERWERAPQRGSIPRGGDELRSWLGFGNDDPTGEYGRGALSWGQANEGGNWGSGDRGFGPQDPTYLSWRDRQIAELDRDYEEFCRERGQDFGSAFDNWRRSRGQEDAGGTAGADSPVAARPKG